MAVITIPEFRKQWISWPSKEEISTAKADIDIALKDIPAKYMPQVFRDGWSMVDGTLIPLARKPGLSGANFFDRKCNYSFTVQVSSTMFYCSCFRG